MIFGNLWPIGIFEIKDRANNMQFLFLQGFQETVIHFFTGTTLQLPPIEPFALERLNRRLRPLFKFNFHQPLPGLVGEQVARPHAIRETTSLAVVNSEPLDIYDSSHTSIKSHSSGGQSSITSGKIVVVACQPDPN